MTDVVELIRWVETQLDAAEALARQGIAGSPDRDHDREDYEALEAEDALWRAAQIHSLSCGYSQLEMGGEGCDCGGPQQALAEVAAKRAILAKWHAITATEIEATAKGWSNVADLAAEKLAVLYPVVLLLAQPWAGRPGWRDEWQVQA